MENLIDKTVKGSLWSYGAEIIAKVITPLSFLILTRVISPEGYGIVAVATTVLMFVNILSDLGTSQVIIQAPDNDKIFFKKICCVGFWINVLIGTSLFILVEFFAKEIAFYYKQPDSKLVIQVMAIQIIFISLSSVQNSLKRKELNYKYLFYLRLVTIFTPIVIAIPIAFAGGGLWAIVTSNVIGTILQSLFLWKHSSWKPSIGLSVQALKYLFSKSIWNSFNQLFIWIPISMDTYLVGKYMNATDLGLYTTARSLFSSCSGLILTPIIPVIFSSLSKVNNPDEYKRITYSSQKILFSISAYFSILVFIFADDINLLLFNQQWQGITPILQIIFLIMGLEYFGSVIYEAIRAKGWFKQMSILYFISLFLIIPLLYTSAKTENISTYTIGRSLSLYIPMIGIFLLAKKLGIYFSKCIKNNSLVLILILLIIPLIIYIQNNISNIKLCFALKTILFVFFSMLFYLSNNKMIRAIYGKIMVILNYRIKK